MAQTNSGATGVLTDAVRELELPIGLIDLRDFSVVAISEAACRFLGIPASRLVGHDVLQIVETDERENARAALEAVRSGAIDFYRSHRHIGAGKDPSPPASQWVRAVSIEGHRYALAEWAPGGEFRQSALARHLGYEPAKLAVGRIDAGWAVVSVSCEIEDLLGIPAKEMIGRVLLGAVAQQNVQSLLDAARQTSTGVSVALRVELRDREGDWKPLCCVLCALSGSTDRLFILIDEEKGRKRGSAVRASELEQHLWRIAAEIEASGILQQVGQPPDITRIPEMRTLSVRQWEVLSRLVRGERVPRIASELSVSPSTVRNHLSAIFRRFGVHSQAELLGVLAKTR